eukprot:3346779-Prymnesium_polylepis.1
MGEYSSTWTLEKHLIAVSLCCNLKKTRCSLWDCGVTYSSGVLTSGPAQHPLFPQLTRRSCFRRLPAQPVAIQHTHVRSHANAQQSPQETRWRRVRSATYDKLMHPCMHLRRRDQRAQSRHARN